MNSYPDRAPEVDGPAAEHYRELRETEGLPWPRPAAITQAEHRALLARAEADRAAALRILAEAGAFGPRKCPECGGPRILPDLASTLAYKHGYAETIEGRWVHQ